MKINKIYIMAALVCACFSSCSSSDDVADDAATTQTLVPLSTISLGGAATVSSAGAKAATRGVANKAYNFFEIETSFDGHDGSSADKPLSVGYYYDPNGFTYDQYMQTILGSGSLLNMNLQPVSTQMLKDAGYTVQGTAADGALLVPISGEFRMRIHGTSAYDNTVSKETVTSMKSCLDGTAKSKGGTFFFWNGTAKMNGNSLVATTDDNAVADKAGKTVDEAGTIGLYVPSALIKLQVIGAYGEATAEKPYLDDNVFGARTNLTTSENKWTAPVAVASGTADNLTSPWTTKASETRAEASQLYFSVAPDSHVDEYASDGKTRNLLFALIGNPSNATYKQQIYYIYVPAGGVTYKAGYKYTYNVKLTQSTATIESVSVSGFKGGESYTIDMDGNVVQK